MVVKVSNGISCAAQKRFRGPDKHRIFAPPPAAEVFSNRSYSVYMNQTLFAINGNAVIDYIWIAIAASVLVTILKKHLNLVLRPYTIQEMLSLTLFKKRPFYRDRHLSTNTELKTVTCNQSSIFN